MPGGDLDLYTGIKNARNDKSMRKYKFKWIQGKLLWLIRIGDHC
jgi:hypothetical protein